ncbi:hypothetical protein NKH69_00350 [Mesorhizobium sp. M0976]|uniref:hypothetical protein n=1 Tax=Mesorhizobium sp. M0976 TaxID=2957038 RepID=UPI00333ACC25
MIAQIAPGVHVRKITFIRQGEFAAEDAGVGALQVAGFSVGRKQAHAPRGILFGLYDIQKWRNLSADDREALHGVMHSGRGLPCTIELFDAAPREAKLAFAMIEARP